MKRCKSRCDFNSPSQPEGFVVLRCTEEESHMGSHRHAGYHWIAGIKSFPLSLDPPVEHNQEALQELE